MIIQKPIDFFSLDLHWLICFRFGMFCLKCHENCSTIYMKQKSNAQFATHFKYCNWKLAFHIDAWHSQLFTKRALINFGNEWKNTRQLSKSWLKIVTRSNLSCIIDVFISAEKISFFFCSFDRKNCDSFYLQELNRNWIEKK